MEILRSDQLQLDDYDTYQREREFIEEIVVKYKVFMFSKSYCPICKQTKAIFLGSSIKFTVLELDNHLNGPNIQDALEELTGGPKPVPAVFINKKYRGGLKEIHAAWADGSLEEWLKGKETNYTFDLVVVGGGPGGLSCAKEAARCGKNVVICDYVSPSPKGSHWGLGGSCNAGCLPKLLMHRAALIYHDLKDADYYGWEVEPPETHNWEHLIEKVQEQAKNINWEHRKELRELGVGYYYGKARFVDNHTVEVEDADKKKTILQARSIVIATGSRPMYLDANGAEDCCITTDDLFSLKTHPGRVLIIGGGYIAMECASFLNGLGCEVKVMVRTSILRGLDKDMAEKLGKHMESRGIEFVYGARVTQFKKGSDNKVAVEGVAADNSNFQEAFDTVILAVGRCPNSSDLDLDKIGIEVDKISKKIAVNKREQTTVSNIFALGDVRQGTPEIEPAASKGGKLLAQRLYKLSDNYVNYCLTPVTVFTTMEYAFVGETEEHAQRIHGDNIEVYHNIFQPYESIISNRFDSRSYIKLICYRIPGVGEKIVGLHILGPHAGEIIQGYALAIKLGATKDDLDSVAGVHPTNAEFITNLNVTKRSGEEIGNNSC